MKHMRITIKDIANECGVSPITVSRVIANSPNVRENTRQAVLSAMQRLNYPSSTNAVQEERPPFIAVLIDDLLNNYYSSMIGEISVSLNSYGYLPLICYCNDKTINNYLTLYPQSVSGFIAVSLLGFQADILSDASSRGIPLVSIHRCPMFSSVHSIVADDFSNAYLSVKYLSSLGHTNIALITNTCGLAGVQEAIIGYNTAIKEFNLTENSRYIISSTCSYDSLSSIFMDFQQIHPPVTAIICPNEAAARILYDCAIMNHLSVPEDLSIVTFDMPDNTSSLRFTSVGVSYSQFANEAVKTIIRFINFPDEFSNKDSFYKIVLKSTFYSGFSTAKPAL